MIFWTLVGIILGWFFLPIPAFMQNAMERIGEKFPLLGGLLRK